MLATAHATAFARLVRAFFDEEQGATMIEYGLLAALISVVAAAALTGIGLNVNQLYALVCSALITPISSAACT